MTRRGFLGRLGAAFAALSLGRCATDPPLVLADLAPKTIHFDEIDRFLAADMERMRANILRALLRPSPYLALLNAETFPSNAGACQIQARNPLPGNGV